MPKEIIKSSIWSSQLWLEEDYNHLEMISKLNYTVQWVGYRWYKSKNKWMLVRSNYLDGLEIQKVFLFSFVYKNRTCKQLFIS